MKKLFIISIGLFLLLGCSSSRKTRDRDVNQATTYKKEGTTIHPQFVVFNISDTTSELHFKISSKELLYMRPDGINFYSNVLLSYRLMQNFDSKEILDSSSVRLADQNNKGEDKFLIGKITFHAKKLRTYYLRITVSDLNKNTSVSSVMEVDKSNDLNRQNFLVKTKADDVPLFSSYAKKGEQLVIQYKAKIAVDVYVRYYNRDFPLAAPPFSVVDEEPFKYKADSTFALQLSNDGSLNFAMNKKGFYHFQLDTSKRDGITVFNFSAVFPEIKKAEDMVPPLRFITTKPEFQSLANSKTPKSEVEKFWINSTGDKEKARESIQRFYNRMQDANMYYTSYLEGWKTDRGMIYIIFGAPSIIYRTANSETWTYGEENNINSLQYTFSKVNNPFTDNDFLLERSSIYKQNWYTAVDVWRSGKVNLQD